MTRGRRAGGSLIRHFMAAVSFLVSRIDPLASQQVEPPEVSLYRADATYPVLSPDGRFLAYSAGTGFDRDLHLVDLVTGGVRLLTDTDDEDSAPDWSPDGTRLVFQRETPDGNRDLWVVERDGTGARPLRPTAGVSEQHPRFSPDGRWILFDCNCDEAGRPIGDADYDIHRIAISGDQVRALVVGGGWDMYPSLSGDGRRLAWRREIRDRSGTRRFQIVVRNLDDGSDRIVTPEAAGWTNPHFSPRDERLVFTADRGLGSQLYMVDLADLMVRRVTGMTSSARYERPTFTADGRAVIATRRTEPSVDIVRIPVPDKK